MLDKLDAKKLKTIVSEDKEAKDVLLMTLRMKILDLVSESFDELADNSAFCDLVGEALCLAANDWKIMCRIAEKGDI